MARSTVRFLHRRGLPDGPVVVNPVSAIRSLRLEFLPSETASPSTFKKAAMREIQHSICPVDDNRKAVSGQLHTSCLIAGLGNKETDNSAYKEVGIPHIFCVNRRGRVHVMHVGDGGQTQSEEHTTYELMAQEVKCFPVGPFPARDGG